MVLLAIFKFKVIDVKSNFFLENACKYKSTLWHVSFTTLHSHHIIVVVDGRYSKWSLTSLKRNLTLTVSQDLCVEVVPIWKDQCVSICSSDMPTYCCVCSVAELMDFLLWSTAPLLLLLNPLSISHWGWSNPYQWMGLGGHLDLQLGADFPVPDFCSNCHSIRGKQFEGNKLFKNTAQGWKSAWLLK